MTTRPSRTELRELALLFLKLGTTAFGGPAAHIAMMDEEVVRRRKWLDRQRFLDLLGATNLIPGPNSTELAIHIGYERAGVPGLLVAGSAFILPAMAIVWALAAVYDRYQTLPQLGWLMYGIKPVIIAVVVQALWGLLGTAAKSIPTKVAASAAVALSLMGFAEIPLLFATGLGVMASSNWRALAGKVPVVPTPEILLYFIKIGSVLYGSGYVLLAFLQNELVTRLGWLTQEQLLDAIAIGQFTPGPVFTTATFVGYLAGGHAGAAAGTIGIFLPAFVFVWLSKPWIRRLRQSAWAGGFLDGVTAASLGLMAAVTVRLGMGALIDPVTILLSLLALGALVRFKVNSAWLVLGGGLVGFAAHVLGLG